MLVTGGAGFIGSNLVEALLRRGDDVRVLDDFSTGRRENLAGVSEWRTAGEYTLVEGDIRDGEACRRAVDGVDWILHKAAIPSALQSVRDPVATHEVNLDGTLRLLESAREAGVKRFVFASSSAIYGEGELLPKDESMLPDPVSPYGLHKLAGEGYCNLYSRLYGLPTIALRYFNVFGPRQDPTSEYSAVIPRFIAATREGRPATIYGDGEQTRDFVFVDNVVQANLLACEAADEACGKAYNIACGERVSLNDLLRRISRLTGGGVPAEHAEPRAGDVRHSVAAIERATAGLGYRPAVDLMEGLRRTLEAV